MAYFKSVAQIPISFLPQILDLLRTCPTHFQTPCQGLYLLLGLALRRLTALHSCSLVPLKPEVSPPQLDPLTALSIFHSTLPETDVPAAPISQRRKLGLLRDLAVQFCTHWKKPD